MPDRHCPAMPHVTAVDGQFGTHRARIAASSHPHRGVSHRYRCRVATMTTSCPRAIVLLKWQRSDGRNAGDGTDDEDG
jgi:hypothetical protein